MTGASAERLLLVIAAVIVVGPFLAERARLPGIVGLVVGGAIVGPSGIGLLEDGQHAGLGDDRAVALAVGSTAITDTLALVILAVVASTSGGGGGAAIAELAVGLVAIGGALFIPAFLVFVGTQLDLAVLLDVRTLVLAVVFLGVVVIGKALAAVVMGLRERFAPAEIGLLAGLTTGQAAATLAAALVAQQRELFTADLSTRSSWACCSRSSSARWSPPRPRHASRSTRRRSGRWASACCSSPASAR